MARENLVVGLDVGTTKIAAIVAEIDSGQVNIIGEGTYPSLGLRRGVVVDLDNTVKSIERAVEKAERMAGVTIDNVFVGIAGEHINSLNSHGVIAVSHRSEIAQDDINRVLDAAKIIPLPSDREIIHLIPRDYIIDGQNGIKNPIGMSGMRLEVSAHIVTGGVSFIQNLLKCVQKVGLIVNDLVLQSIASAEAILSFDEKEIGVALVDIGGGTTDLAIFHEGSIVYTKVMPIAGSHIDRDIAYGLSTTLSEAERVKKEYGFAISKLVNKEEIIKIREVGERKEREIPKLLIAEIVEARTREIFDLIREEVSKSTYQDLIPAGIVITGGTSLLKGIEELARESLEMPIRVGLPKNIGGLAEQVQSPIYSTGVGLVLYGSKHFKRIQPVKKATTSFIGAIFAKIKNWLKEFI